MTPEERQLLAGLLDRTRAAAGNSRDREAESMIAQAVRDMPAAPYFWAQAVIVQEEALKAAGARIEELEEKARELESQGSGGGFLGGLGKSIFGDARPTRQPEPEPRRGPWDRQPEGDRASWSRRGGDGLQGGAPQGSQGGGPGQWAQPQQPQAGGGGSFLKGALGTAAGVAGGMMLANSLSGLFKGNDALGLGSGLDKTAGSSGFDPMPKSPEGSSFDNVQRASYDQNQAGYDNNAGYDNDDSDGGGWDSGDGGTDT